MTDAATAAIQVATKATLDSIARSHFPQLTDRRDPLAAQGCDAKDFIDAAVGAIRAALEEAHMCGWAEAEAHHKVCYHAE
jgi:hypothetical protein